MAEGATASVLCGTFAYICLLLHIFACFCHTLNNTLHGTHVKLHGKFLLTNLLRNYNFQQLVFFGIFLAALSSSRSPVVGPSVRPSVGELCEKVTFRVLNSNLNLPT